MVDYSVKQHVVAGQELFRFISLASEQPAVELVSKFHANKQFVRDYIYLQPTLSILYKA